MFDLNAYAFVRTILAHPHDETPRIVFADWLEETENDSNTAWAHFIRANVRRSQMAKNDSELKKQDQIIQLLESRIRCSLVIRATQFIKGIDSILRFVPAANIRLDLADFVVPESVIENFPESIARENCALPLGCEPNLFVVAVCYPDDQNLRAKFEFMLDRSFVGIQAPKEEIEAAIIRAYGIQNYEIFDSPPLFSP